MWKVFASLISFYCYHKFLLFTQRFKKKKINKLLSFSCNLDSIQFRLTHYSHPNFSCNNYELISFQIDLIIYTRLNTVLNSFFFFVHCTITIEINDSQTTTNTKSEKKKQLKQSIRLIWVLNWTILPKIYCWSINICIYNYATTTTPTDLIIYSICSFFILFGHGVESIYCFWIFHFDIFFALK